MTEGEERLVEGDGNDSHVGQKAIDSAKSFGGECNCLEPCIAILIKKKRCASFTFALHHDIYSLLSSQDFWSTLRAKQVTLSVQLPQNSSTL